MSSLTPDSSAPSPEVRVTLRTHFVETLRLALPVVAARCGIVTMFTVDIAMCGRTSSKTLAHYGIGFPAGLSTMILMIGMLLPVSILVSQARGSGEFDRCGRVWVAGLVLAILIGCFFGGFLYWADPILALIDPQPELAEGGRRVMQALALGMPGIGICIASILLLESLGRPVWGLVIMVGANIVNALLNIPMIEAYGAEGAALSLSATRWLMGVVGVACVLVQHDRARLGIVLWSDQAAIEFRRFVSLVMASLRRMWVIGLPIAAGVGVESLAFATVGVFAGRLGEIMLSAHQIVFNLLAIVFMFAIGLGTAATVRVGICVGRRDMAGVRSAGWTASGMVMVVMAVFGTVIWLAGEGVVEFYTRDPLVVAAVLVILPILPLMLVFDGLQGVLMGALRGAGDVRWPVVYQFLAFWGVAVLGAWYWGISGGGGVLWFMIAFAFGVVIASIQLALRFWLIGRRGVVAIRT